MKTKIDLKDVFNGVSSLLFQSAVVDLSQANINLSPEYDLPVTVDTLEITQDDPTINHYKVIGLAGDWTSSAEVGETSIKFTVPTKNTDVLKLGWGADAVKDVTATVANTTTLDGTYKGVSLNNKKHKVTGTFVLVNEEETDIMVVTNVALYAKPLYDNPGTNPFAVEFSGTIEGAGTPSMAWLKKQLPGG
ncbi:hypothetical protein [Bacteroides pyogenes]|uniref:hypothetical protein n=1 Tax=Bacteroides pyogenes TaxID=310300 RepID=UPI002FDAC492